MLKRRKRRRQVIENRHGVEETQKVEKTRDEAMRGREEVQRRH